MADQFNPGDVVVLKSGGPKMTVETVGNEAFGGKMKVWCVWFEDTKQKSGNFALETLKHVE